MSDTTTERAKGPKGNLDTTDLKAIKMLYTLFTTQNRNVQRIMNLHYCDRGIDN